MTQPSPTSAQPIASRLAAASGLYFEGKGVAARAELIRLLDDPAFAAPAPRMGLLATLLDICIVMEDARCLVDHAPKYLDAMGKAAPGMSATLRRDRARTAAYYLDSARFAVGSDDAYRAILESGVWKQESSINGEIYLRRQVLALKTLIAAGRRQDAAAAADKVLSMIATLTNPQDGRMIVAWALAETIEALVTLGQTERAHGIYRATGDFVPRNLPVLSIHAAKFRMIEAVLLEQVGDLAGAEAALAQAGAALDRIELGEELRSWLPANVRTLRAAVCTFAGRLDCARGAMSGHPYQALYAGPPRGPATFEELAYLAARAVLAAAEGQADEVAATALSRPLGFEAAPDVMGRAEIYRSVGRALASPPGSVRRAGFAEAARRIVEAASLPTEAAFGAWLRPGTIDRILIGLALAEAAQPDSRVDAGVTFGLFQLAGRLGPVFDSDSLTALGQARDALQRRSTHEALRLYARRNRLERAELRRMAKLAQAPATNAVLGHHALTRLSLRDFSFRIEDARRRLAAAGVSTSGANLAPLKSVQATLSRDEAALAVAPVFGGLSYICIREDRVQRLVMPVDLRALSIDTRLVQNALTASHAASEELDSQFPVEAAVRLYDALVRPFGGCLRPGDHLLWLPSELITTVPVAALLERAPPRTARGYDLAGAAWVVKAHSVAYPGSAAMLLAARRSARPADAEFDFLGVGDPELADLPPLPETRDELEQSARGFSRAKLLLGRDAKERSFRNELIGSYRYLSFATHGLLREELAGLAEPALALTRGSSADASDDGLLSADEIADLKLSARFVALSACNTANYDLAQFSTELPALASAFAVAGVPSTLATLWYVDSESSRRTVAAVFDQLRAASQTDPARALAVAQRRFLAAPPSRAYLHPRFWAPFVVLGDAPAPSAPARGMRLASVQPVPDSHGGEVVTLGRAEGRLAARFVGGLDSSGRHASGVLVSAPDGAEAWRRESRTIGAAGPVVQLGRRLVVGGYRQDARNRIAPTLEAYDAGSGALESEWTEGMPGLDAVIVGQTRIDSRTLVFAVAGNDRRGGRAGAKVRVYRTGEPLEPALLFEASPPPGARADEVALASADGLLFVALTNRFGGPRNVRYLEEEYDQRLCGTEATTWLEVRDLATGAVRASKVLPGVIATAAAARDGRFVLAGSRQASCADDQQAVLMSFDRSLAATTVFADTSLGGSEVRGFAPTADRSTLLLIRKESILDFRHGENDAGERRGDKVWTAMLVEVDHRGRSAAPKFLDAGLDIHASALDASDPGRVVVGGALGDRAALFHFVRAAP